MEHTGNEGPRCTRLSSTVRAPGASSTCRAAFAPCCSSALVFSDARKVTRGAGTLFESVTFSSSSLQGSSWRTGRISMLPSRAGGILEAIWMASFRSRASSR